MVNTVYDALKNLKYRFQKILETPDQTVFRFGIGLENGKVDCIVDVRIPDKCVLISTIFTVNIPENKRKHIAEFITRANHNLILGCFDLDFDDGELKYKCNFVYDDTFPQTEEVFIKNLFASFLMLDRYLPGIMSVVYANIEPKTAINQIEQIADPSMN